MSDPLIGSRLGPFEVESIVGRGGMGVVYRAVHVHLERLVALKVLSDALADDERFRERFAREGKIAARLRHPNVVPIFDAGEIEGRLFIAMEFIEGSDLRQVLERERFLPPDRAVSILAPVAGALDTAHSIGLVHRDVKPENILLGKASRADRVLLSDFGVSKLIDAVSRLTSTGYLVGTASYMAPELLRGEKPEGPADQYSLACVLFECLTGAAPYPRDSAAAVMSAHLFEPVPSATAIAPGLRREIDDVISRGMAKQPAERFANCEELMAEARSVFERRAEIALTTAALPPSPPPATPTAAQIPPEPDPLPAASVDAAPRSTEGPRRRLGARTLGIIAGAVVAVTGVVLLLLPSSDRTNNGGNPTGATGSQAVDEGANTGPAVGSDTGPATGSDTDTSGPFGEDLLYVSMDLIGPPFDDVHVRRAVNYAIDKAALARAEADATVATHLFSDDLERNALADYDPFATPDHAGDLAAAQQEMAQSLYDTDGDGVCDIPECHNLASVINFGSASRFQAIEAALEPLGLTFDSPSVRANPPVASECAIDAVDLCLHEEALPTDADEVANVLGNAILSSPSVRSLTTGLKTCRQRDTAPCWADLDQVAMEEAVTSVPLIIYRGG